MKISTLFLVSMASAANKFLGEKCISFNNDYQVSDICLNSDGKPEETLECCRAIY